MSTVEVPRPPRAGPRLPGGELTVEPPPEPERPVPPALLARLLTGGDAAGLGRVRRPGPARPVVVDVRRHVRAVDGRDAARRRRGPQRGPAAGRRRRGTARLPALPGGHAAPGANRRRRAASRAGARASRPRSLAGGARRRQVVGAPRHGPRLRRAARGHRSAAAGHDAGRPSDGPGGGTRAGHGARPAPLPACARGRPRPAGRAVAAWHRRDLARGRTGRRTRARPRTGPRPRGAVRAVAQPGRRAAGRGRTAVPGAGVGVGEVAAARRPPAVPRRRRAGADGDGAGRRRPAVVGGRAGGSGPGRRSGRPAPARRRRRGGRARLVGRRGRNDGAAHRRAAGQAADAGRRAPASWGRSTCPGRTTRESCAPSAARTPFPSRRPRPWPAASPATGPPEPVPQPVRPPRRACPSCSVWAGEHRAGRRSARRRSTPCAGAAGTPRTGCTCRSGSTRPECP